MPKEKFFLPSLTSIKLHTTCVGVYVLLGHSILNTETKTTNSGVDHVDTFSNFNLINIHGELLPLLFHLKFCYNKFHWYLSWNWYR